MAFAPFPERVIPPVEAACIPREVKSIAKRLGAHTASRVSVALASRMPVKYRPDDQDRDLENLVRASGMGFARLPDKDINKTRSCIKRYVSTGKQVWIVHLCWYEYSSTIDGGMSWHRMYALMDDGDTLNSAAVCARIRGGQAVVDVHQS
jgi:hypothetical protein